jgi:hypothetical protein
LDYDWHKYTDMPEENKGQFIYNYPDRDW